MGFLRNMGGWELIIVLLVLVLLFGARKIPDLARSLGASAKEFRKGLDEGASDSDDEAGKVEQKQNEA